MEHGPTHWYHKNVILEERDLKYAMRIVSVDRTGQEMMNIPTFLDTYFETVFSAFQYDWLVVLLEDQPMFNNIYYQVCSKRIRAYIVPVRRTEYVATEFQKDQCILIVR